MYTYYDIMGRNGLALVCIYKHGVGGLIYIFVVLNACILER